MMVRIVATVFSFFFLANGAVADSTPNFDSSNFIAQVKRTGAYTPGVGTGRVSGQEMGEITVLGTSYQPATNIMLVFFADSNKEWYRSECYSLREGGWLCTTLGTGYQRMFLMRGR